MPQLYTYPSFFLPYFFCPFCRFFILVFLSFSFIFSTSSWKWRPTLFTIELRHLFLWFSGHSVKRSLETMTEQIKSKDLRRQAKEWMAVFFTNCVRNIIEKAVRICVIIPQNRKVKNFHFTLSIKVSSTTVWVYVTEKSWKALNRKRQCTLHASMVSEGFANFIPKEDRPANSRDVNPPETIWIITELSPTRQHTKIQPPKQWTNLDSDYASRGRMWLWALFGSSYILYLTA